MRKEEFALRNKELAASHRESGLLTVHLFLLAAVIMVVAGLVAPDGSMDYHVHDTMYVFGYRLIYLALALFFAGWFVVYRFTYRFLHRRSLILVHFIGTILLILGFLTADSWLVNDSTSVNINALTKDLQDTAQKEMLLMLAALLVQLIYVLNLVMGLTRRKHPRAGSR